MVTQLQPDVRAYLHGGEVIKRYIRVEEVAHEYGFSVEETEYIAKSAIEKGLTESQLVELINNNISAEKMKEIIEIAVLENSLAD